MILEGSQQVDHDNLLSEIDTNIQKISKNLAQWPKETMIKEFQLKIASLQNIYKKKQQRWKNENEKIKQQLKSEKQKLQNFYKQYQIETTKSKNINLEKQLTLVKKSLVDKQLQINSIISSIKQNTALFEAKRQFESQKQTLNKRIKQLQTDLEASKTTIDQSKDKHIHFQQKIKQLQQKLHNSQQSYRSLLKVKDILQIEGKGQKIRLERQYRQTVEKLTNLKDKTIEDEKQQMDRKYKQTLNYKDIEIKQMKATNDGNINRYKQLEQKYNKLRQQNNKLNNKIEIKQKDLVLIKRQNNQLKKLLLQKQNIEQIKTTYQEEINQSYDYYNQTINQQMEKINQKLKTQLNQHKQQYIKTISTNQSNLTNQIDSKQSEINKLNQQLIKIKDTHQKTLVKSRQQILSRNSQIQQTKSIIINLCMQIDKKSNPKQIASASQIILKRFNQLNQQLTYKQSRQVQDEQLIQSHEEQFKEITRLITNMYDLLQSKGTSIRSNKNHKLRNKQLTSAYQKFYDAFNKKISENNSTIASYMRNISELKTDLGLIKNDKNALQSDLRSANSTLQSKKVEVNTLQAEKRSFERQINELTFQLESTKTQLKSLKQNSQNKSKNLQQALGQKQAKIISQEQELLSIEKIRIPAFNQKIFQESNKSKKLQSDKNNLQQQLSRKNQENNTLATDLQRIKSQSENASRRLTDSLKRQQKLKQQRQQELNQIIEKIVKINNIESNNINVPFILDYLQKNKSKPGQPLSVSLIFQKAIKQRSNVQKIIAKTCSQSFSTTFLYKFDEFHKSFSNYLPLTVNFTFLIVAKLKNSQIFGIISKGLGPKSTAVVFNATSGKSFASFEGMNSSVFESGLLVFGQNEIRFKNNSNLEGAINSQIFGKRMFNFNKQDIIGKEDSLSIDALEIHKIDY